jgi:hypothetical protein
MVLDRGILMEIVELPKRKAIVFSVGIKKGMTLRTLICDCICFGKLSNDQFTVVDGKVILIG